MTQYVAAQQCNNIYGMACKDCATLMVKKINKIGILTNKTMIN